MGLGRKVAHWIRDRGNWKHKVLVYYGEDVLDTKNPLITTLNVAAAVHQVLPAARLSPHYWPTKHFTPPAQWNRFAILCLEMTIAQARDIARKRAAFFLDHGAELELASRTDAAEVRRLLFIVELRPGDQWPASDGVWFGDRLR